MNFSPNSFVSVNEILADVLKTVDDSSFRDNSRGYYVSQIQQALEELSFDTYFHEQLETFEVPENLRLEMPKGAFNIRQIYLFNGTICNIGQNTKNVYHKRNYITGGSGFLARDKYRNNNDPFYQDRSFGHNSRAAAGDDERGINNLFFYNVQNGIIMLSESCKKFEKIAIVFNGVSTDVGDVPVVPNFLRQAVKDYTSLAALEAKMSMSKGAAEFNKWQTMYALTERNMKQEFDGSWAKAERRVKALDSKEREDLKEYLSQPDIA